LKKVIYCTGIILILITALILLIVGGLSTFLNSRIPTLERMEEIFIDNKNEMQKVIDFLIETGFENITIRSDLNGEINNSEMIVRKNIGSPNFSVERIRIEQIEIVSLINSLFSQGYRAISKYSDKVIFLVWSTIDHGRGIVYSLTGETPQENENGLTFLTELEPLSTENWYFYVENFNEWRRKQTSE